MPEFTGWAALTGWLSVPGWLALLPVATQSRPLTSAFSCEGSVVAVADAKEEWRVVA
jgi:hypothetical protein